MHMGKAGHLAAPSHIPVDTELEKQRAGIQNSKERKGSARRCEEKSLNSHHPANSKGSPLPLWLSGNGELLRNSSLALLFVYSFGRIAPSLKHEAP